MANVGPIQVGTIRLFGVTDQASVPVFGTATFFPVTMVAGVTTKGAAVNATAFPNIQSGTLRHFAQIKSGMNQGGETGQKIAHDQGCTLELVCIPEGSTLANAIVSTSMVGALGYLTLAHFPVIPFGPFSDVFNSANWQYEQGAELTPIADNIWGLKIPIMRYLSAAMASP